MPGPAPEGFINNTVCDAGTLCRNASLPKRPLGVGSELSGESDAARLQAATAALLAVELQVEIQNIGLELNEIGQYQGSEYHPSAKQKTADKAKATKANVDIRVTNCITLLKDAVIAYQDARLQPWGQITKRAEDDDDRGTTLLKEFRARAGATTVYVIATGEKVDASVRRTLLGPSKAPFKRGINSKKRYDVRLPIDEFVAQKTAVEKLHDVPFGLGLVVQEWGVHTFIYSYGNTYEVHWDKGPRSKKVFEKRTLEKFMEKWGSVVIAVAPGPWSFGASALKLK